jgi:hypothetical protein
MKATEGTTLDSGNMILAGGSGGGTTGDSASTTPTGVSSGDSTTKASSSDTKPHCKELVEAQEKAKTGLKAQHAYNSLKVTQYTQKMDSLTAEMRLTKTVAELNKLKRVFIDGKAQLNTLNYSKNLIEEQLGLLGHKVTEEDRAVWQTNYMNDLLQTQKDIINQNAKDLQEALREEDLIKENAKKLQQAEGAKTNVQEHTDLIEENNKRLQQGPRAQAEGDNSVQEQIDLIKENKKKLQEVMRAHGEEAKPKK